MGIFESERAGVLPFGARTLDKCATICVKSLHYAITTYAHDSAFHVTVLREFRMSSIAAADRGSVFSSISFRQYYIGQAFSLAGDGLRTLAVPLLVYKLTGSALSTGAAYACEFVPFALLSVPAGSLADRLDRRMLMIGSDAIRCLVMVVLALLFMRHALTVSAVYGGLVLLSICAAVFMGGQSSSIPFLLGKERATQAQAALMGAESVSQMALPAAGGALLATFGPMPALLINALTYLISQYSLSRIPTLGPERTSGLPNVRELRDDMRTGFRLLFADPGMRAQSFISLTLNIVGFGGYTILIPFLKRGFGATDYQVSLFWMIAGCGAVLGSLFATRFARHWPFGRALTSAYIVDTVLFLPVILTHNIWVAGTFWAFGNACVQFEISQIIGFRLRVIPEEYVGRVFGAVRLLVLCGVPVGTMFFGYVADHYSPRAGMTISALACLTVAIVAVCSPAIRNERR
ncbi:MAG: MFS transporter [Vulcanimicrobiaceae bacterium]